jgi:hypothetical protein
MGKTLKDKQKTSATMQVDGKKQMRLWKDLLRQMEIKLKLTVITFILFNLIFKLMVLQFFKIKKGSSTTYDDLNDAYNSIPDDFNQNKR